MSRDETPETEYSVDRIAETLGRIEDILERLAEAVIERTRPTPALDPRAYHLTRDAVRAWRHSVACEEGPRDLCSCGVAALQGMIDRETNPRDVFTLRAEVRR